MKNRIAICALIALIICLIPGIFRLGQQYRENKASERKLAEAAANYFASSRAAETALYSGIVYHIFFHSLIAYPELAAKDVRNAALYRDHMITRDEFKKILFSLYQNGYALIDISSIYQVETDGRVTRKQLYMPKGKKPLIISLDDLNYYGFMKGHGFADKLVLDADERVATEIVAPDGKMLVTRDGDVVPIIDDFVRDHPDFSVNGAKGIIAVTGFEGILGYRTQPDEKQLPSHRLKELFGAKPVVEELKRTGWKFASHSYSHDHSFQIDTISLDAVKADTEKWQREVGSIVGKTDIFIGPFGQIFQPGDPRREYLVSQGFHMLAGVGMDHYLRYFSDHAVIDRTDIDGYRLRNNALQLKGYFDTASVLVPAL
ncbi:MAG: glycoside hydrolase/deacetylase [Candidatus Taylorbacteria bacterium]|nr:glycoside hydrolase/deacetylase [Candidatus Taylorbacteria bacterium]